MNRTSSYTIYVDLPENDQEVLLVHGYTGAYDKVSRNVVNFLRSRGAKKPGKPLYGDWAEEPDHAAPGSPSAETLAILQEQGYLFTALLPPPPSLSLDETSAGA